MQEAVYSKYYYIKDQLLTCLFSQCLIESCLGSDGPLVSEQAVEVPACLAVAVIGKD